MENILVFVPRLCIVEGDRGGINLVDPLWRGFITIVGDQSFSDLHVKGSTLVFEIGAIYIRSTLGVQGPVCIFANAQIISILTNLERANV
jgi:hypothetical protein